MEEGIEKTMNKDLLSKLRTINKTWDNKSARMLSPLQLAYIGDAVYELFIRTYLLGERDISVHELHNEAVKYVKAKSQADTLMNLGDKLTEEEWSIVRRGRNAKSGSVPKNASLIDYRHATGFESLIGYLYLTGQDERIMEIFNMII